jgi:hypothetical protein
LKRPVGDILAGLMLPITDSLRSDSERTWRGSGRSEERV